MGQVLRDPQLPPALRHVPFPKCVADDVADIERALFD